MSDRLAGVAVDVLAPRVDDAGEARLEFWLDVFAVLLWMMLMCWAHLKRALKMSRQTQF